MKIFKILRGRYLGLFIFLTLAMLIVYPLLQLTTLGGIQNIDLYFSVMPKINFVLVLIFALAFGFLVSLQVYNFQDKTCSIGQKSGSVGSGGIGTVLAVFVPACPACLSLVSFLLPVALAISVSGFFTKYSTLLLVVSIFLMILGMGLLGGFKKR